MSDVKFFPAPWVVVDKVGYAEVKSHNDDVCSVYGMCSTTKGEQITCDDTLANAYLISAAPDMYNLLKTIQIEGGLSQARHRQVDRAMSKARGEV